MSLANVAYVHLLLNHIPTIGLVLGIALLILSLARKSDDLTRTSLAFFFLVALVAFPTYMSGYAARSTIQGRSGYSEALIEGHQAAALLALMFVEVTGVVAWLGLWQCRRISRPARWNVWAVLLLAIATFGLMARAANMGGEITHTEIRFGEATAGLGLEWFRRSSIEAFVKAYRWTWPVCEVLHFIGLSLLFGVVLLVNLRILGPGVMKRASFADLHRLLPWAVGGFTINAMSGMLFFTVAPQTYTGNLAFHWKMGLMLVAGAAVLYHTLFDEPWALGPGEDAPLAAKAIAVAQIFLWLGVLYFGRMIPYLTGGTSAGAL